MSNDKNEITTPQSVQERVRDKIRSEFAALMTEDEWSLLVKTAWDDLTVKRDRGYNQQRASDLEVIANKAIRDIVTPMLIAKVQASVDNSDMLSGTAMFDMRAILTALNNQVPNIVLDAMISATGYNLQSQIELQVRAAMERNGFIG